MTSTDRFRRAVERSDGANDGYVSVESPDRRPGSAS